MACVREVQSQCFLFLVLVSLLSSPKASAAAVAGSTPFLTSAAEAADSPPFPISLPNCANKCGNITIPYPFGISPGCYRNGFNITCDETTTPPRAYLGTPPGNIELIDINITNGELRVFKYIGFYCLPNYTNDEASMDLKRYPYLFSNKRNKLTVIGCGSLAYIGANTSNKFVSKQTNEQYYSGCLSFCSSINSTKDNDGSCNGLGCCQTSIPAGLNNYGIQWGYVDNSIFGGNCSYAVLLDENWYKFQFQDLIDDNFLRSNERGVPVVLDWAIRDDGASCQLNGVKKPSRACISEHSMCYNASNGYGYLCNCSKGYHGNPYVAGGCIDIDECKADYRCNGICRNTDGDYECPCRKGQKGHGKNGTCTDIIPYPARVAISTEIENICSVTSDFLKRKTRTKYDYTLRVGASILGVVVLLAICFLVAVYQQHKRHNKEKEEYQKYYKMMDNHLSVFSKKQIEIATNNFDETNVLGAGGQGKVYKGVIENKVVAIKKAKEVEEANRGEFVNEILLLSQINHRNIVRLLGCCLEVKIPMLVYEFVPNGSLFELLHEKGKSRSISLGTRLKIALESAVALDYLHSTISQTILHGDVKSANILLDNDCCAKVSDFGASNLVSNDDTQVIKVVQGTRGYLDPEYVATAVLTKKSDVYSFGVVLLELITRKCAIFTDETGGKKNLASSFISNPNKGTLHVLLDKDIITMDEKVIEVLQEMSDLAVWCLNIRGEDRPTMRQVVDKLHNLVKLCSNLQAVETVPEETESLLSEPTYYATEDTSAFHSTGYSSVLEIETRGPR